MNPPRWFAGTLALLLLTVQQVAAQPSLIGPDVPCRDGFATGEFTPDCIPLYIAYLIQQIFSVTGAICMIMIIIGGFQRVLGDSIGGKDKAKATQLWAVVGMIVSALSFFIVDFVISSLAAI